jgi:hypothetical protein
VDSVLNSTRVILEKLTVAHLVKKCHRLLWNSERLIAVFAIACPTSWSRVLLENLAVAQLIKKFPDLYGTHRFITVFTRARHEPDESSPCHQPRFYTTLHNISSHCLACFDDDVTNEITVSVCITRKLRNAFLLRSLLSSSLSEYTGFEYWRSV